MLAITTKDKRCLINDRDNNTGFILYADKISNEDLVELYLWCYSIIDSRAREKAKHGK